MRYPCRALLIALAVLIAACTSNNTPSAPSSSAPTLTGTNFVAGTTTVAVSGSGVTVSAVTVTTATSLTATLTMASTATSGARNVTVTTSSGTSAAQILTVNALAAPTFTGLSPATG